METIHLTYPHNLEKEKISPSVAAIGFFDGIHEGHQAVIQTAVQKAKEKQLKSAVITFFPHPSVVLKKGKETVHYITTVNEKEAFLSELDVDYLYIITFNKELSQLSPAQFIEHFIMGLHIKHLVAGFDYTFGHKGAGNMDNIQTFLSNEVEITVIDKVNYASEKISSTNIRAALKEGDVEKVHQLLGRPYFTSGIVVDGDKRGRQIGFPTANLQIEEDKLLPKKGVYGVYVYIGGKKYYGLLNLGVKPTFHDHLPKPSPEVYILDFEEDIYGERIAVEWITFVREERKFNGIDEIVAQLTKDEKNIRKYFQI